MRIKKLLFVLPFTLFLIYGLCINTSAEESNIISDQLSQSGIYELFDSVDDNTREILESIGIEEVDAESIYSVSPKRIITALIDIITGKIGKPLKILIFLTTISVFGSLLNSITDGKNSETFNAAITLLTATTVIIPVTQSITLAASELKLISTFMLSFIPIFVFLLSSSGNIASAMNFNTLIFSLCELITQFSGSLILPLSSIYISLSIASSVNPVFPFKSISKSINKIITVCLTLCSTVFVGILTLKCNIASNIDAVTVKSVKTVSGAVIPFVGSALGDAYSSIIGSLQLINGTVGFLAIIIIFSMAFPVIAELFLWYLCFRFSAMISEALGCKTHDLISSVAGTVSIVNTVIIFIFAVFIISIGIMLKTRIA